MTSRIRSPKPKLGPGDVLIEVRVIGLNPGEAFIRGMRSAEPAGCVPGPGGSCFACWGILDPERLRVEQLTATSAGAGGLRVRRGYLAAGGDLVQHSVAGAAVTKFLRMVKSFAGADDPGAFPKWGG
jgi:hypothetical protein